VDHAAGWLAGRPVGFPGPGGDRGWALPETAYAGAADASERGQALPAHVRALALARLAPVPGDLLWAVGAGHGALAVEAARFGAAVVAVEPDLADCARIGVNARRYGVEIETVHGSAPDVLGGLPEPDAVAVESGGADVLAAVLARRPERLLVVARTLAEAEEFRKLMAAAGYRTDGALLKSAALGGADGPAFAPGEQTLLLWAHTG
jgi:precorrin-6Y C5,15-methyltransferase (decarboxylating)